MYSPFVLFCSVVICQLPAGCEAGSFWHISDLHLDYEYSVSGNVSNYCHKSNTSSSDSNSSSTETVLGIAGDYRCDAPKILVKSLLQAMKRLEPNPDFIVWTGDNGPHVYNPTPSLSEIVSTQNMVFQELQNLFPDKPVIASLGNHDSNPPDNYPNNNNTDEGNNTSQYYKYYHQGGFDKQLMKDAEAQETFLKCGYYFRTIQDSKGMNMSFLVLNTNVYYYNKASVNGTDPCGQLAWMNKTLSSLEKDQKVFIVAHVPPGSFERFPGVSFFNYNNTVNDEKFGPELEKKYVSLVVDPEIYHHINAHLYGHTHTDSFRLFLSRTGDDHVRGVGFVASSGTPMVGHGEGTNPGMRLYTYADQDGTLMDYQQFGLDLKKLNLDNINQKSESLETSTTIERKRRESEVTTIASEVNEENTTIQTTENTNGEINLTTRPDLKESQVNQTLLGHRGENPMVKNQTLLGHMGENPTFKNQTRFGPNGEYETVWEHLGENPTFSNQTLGYKGENPTAYNQTLGHMGENPTVTNQTLLGHMGENPTVTNQTLLGHMGENPTLNATDKYTQSLIDAISANFTSIYKATEAYGVTNLTAGEMGYAFNQMKYESKVFDDYYMHNTNEHVNGNGLCNQTCYRDHMCTIKNTVTEDLNRCRETNESLIVDISPESVLGDVAKPPTTEKSATLVTSQQQQGSTTVAPTTAMNTPATPEDKPYKPIIPTASPRPKPVTFRPAEAVPNRHDDVPSQDLDSGVEKKASSNSSSQIAGIVLGAAGAILVFAVFGIAMRKYRQRRYRDQEFLLTDSVFRYDGYNQLDDGF